MLPPCGRFVRRLSSAFLLLASIVCFVYLTSNDVISLEQTFLSSEESPRDGSDPVEFASIQSSLIRILSRKSEGKLEMVLSIDSADIVELIQDHVADTVTVNPFPRDPDLLLSNPGVCRDSPDLDFIVYVHTSCKNAERRDLLRKTWANPQLFKDVSFKIIFLMGVDSHDGGHANLKKEFDQYGDIVQGNFADEYRNLTLKAVMGLKWISQYCPHVPYAMKTDDDSFVNIFEIVRLMKENRRKSNVIMCSLWQNNSMPILRDRKTCMKWCVRRRELPGLRFFPQYCAGIAFVLSRQIVTHLYAASRSTPFFWIDDVYVTGLLTKKVPDAIDYVDMHTRMTLREELALDTYRNRTLPLTYDVVHVHERPNFVALWNCLLDRLTAEQKLTLRHDPSKYQI